ncbi:hypothetical protein PHSY_001497 [Pseudozyma hubeiensis SY62]|uniref:Uncharacterized protein n=1 Tax=Pseudozyma hubeiensis (strain SY62) TaxID=1305764 RepID=R9NYW7_PSEHS|nr:hypothetical protein PHSY_001497 [Pseudozyma hubeiensis SY62]GAC93929.1 hypothetical protein PHSY_001497 [Pseudozyma hubeiensis SY62]
MGNTNSAMNRDPPKAHRALCGLRYDNQFGFASTKPQGVTTTCFNDVVLEPLATWVLLFVLLPLLGLALKRKRYNSSSTSRLINYSSNAYRNDSKFSGRHSRLRISMDILYTLLVVAALLMNILQIVRLALANRGVGLLPFNLAGILIVLVLMHLRSASPPAVSLTIWSFWTLLVAFTSVALGGMGKLKGVEDRLGTEYLLSDEMIDVGVQVGLYAVFWIVEATRLLRTSITSRKAVQGSARLPEHPQHQDGLASTQSAENKVPLATA